MRGEKRREEKRREETRHLILNRYLDSILIGRIIEQQNTLLDTHADAYDPYSALFSFNGFMSG